MFDDNTQDTTFERLSLDESLRRTGSVYRKGFVVFTKISVLILGLTALIWVIIMPILLTVLHVNGKDFVDPHYVMDHLTEYYVLFGANQIICVVLGAVAQGMMIKAVADIYLDQEPDFNDCFKLGLKKSGTIMLTSLLVLICVCVGFVLLIAPGLYLSVLWFVVGPAIVIESNGVIQSMKRSWELVSGSWCYVFCTFLIVHFITLVFQLIWLHFVVGGIDASHTLFSVTGSTVSLIPGIVFMPVMGIVITVMYFNLRVEKEGLNAHVLSREIGGGAYNPLVGDDIVTEV